ncbi:MAG: VOC family protein [Phycisphaeraceae bacterium]|nr:MAG: VOC family protein [Phycisphaeraceae bacterium]
MSSFTAERIMSEFEAGRISRREVVGRLMALGAAAAGLGLPGRAARGADDGIIATFEAQRIDHLALNVTDIGRSRDWYMRHLGLGLMREGRTSCFLSCGDDFLALFKSDRPGMHHYSYQIPNYNQRDAAASLRAAGLTPKLRGSRTYFDDPDGIEVQVASG